MTEQIIYDFVKQGIPFDLWLHQCCDAWFESMCDDVEYLQNYAMYLAQGGTDTYGEHLTIMYSWFTGVVLLYSHVNCVNEQEFRKYTYRIYSCILAEFFRREYGEDMHVILFDIETDDTGKREVPYYAIAYG